jgi:hypothetical protein
MYFGGHAVPESIVHVVVVIAYYFFGACHFFKYDFPLNDYNCFNQVTSTF